MGGFATAFTNLAKDGIETVGKKIATSLGRPAVAVASRHVAEDVESGLYHAVFKPEAAFYSAGQVGSKLWEAYSGPYHELTNKYTAQATQTAKAAGSVTPHEDIIRAGKKQAADQVFGPNREVIQGALKHIEKTLGKNKADILSDHFNVLFRESPFEEGKNAGLSRFDVDMRRKTKLSQDNVFESPPSKYRGVGTAEKVAQIHQKVLAYKAAIPHLASNLNILMSDGFATYGKAIAQTFGPGRKAAEAQVLATNSISELGLQGYIEKQKFDKGIIKQFAPNSVGEFIHRNMYIPGMNAVRYNTLMMSAHASLLAAKEAGEHLVQGNTRRAIPMLRELGLDPAKIAAQKGQLLPEDIAKAYYHGTNTRAFLNQSDRRTILGQQSGLYRVIGAFHTYVSNQRAFIGQVFRQQLQQGDYLGIARNISLMTMAFPIVGATIAEAESLLIGKDWSDPTQAYENKLHNTYAGYAYDKLTGKQNAIGSAQAAVGTIEMLAHIASFGVATSYTRAATRNHLANQILGPEGNMVVQGAEDTFKAAHYDDKHPDAAKPLARDILSDMPSYGIGSILSHELLPTKAEEDKNKFHKFHRKKAKSSGWNPLNSDDFKY